MSAAASREYCVVIPLQSIAVGTWFSRSRLPAHVELCPPFRSGPEDVDVLAAVLRRVASLSSCLTVTVGEVYHSRPDGVSVAALLGCDSLRKLHAVLMDTFGSMAQIEPVNPERCGDGYQPRIAGISAHATALGSKLALGSLVLVEVAPANAPSLVVPVAVARIGQAENVEPVSAESAASIWTTLENAGIRSWVIGGWGIDALVGRQTREHHDLDLLVFDEHVGRMLQFMESSHWSVQYLWSENRWHNRIPSAFVADCAGVEVDVHVVGIDGDAVRILSEHSIELDASALTGVGQIAGKSVACATASAQRIMHTGYALPETHKRDLEILAGLDRGE